MTPADPRELIDSIRYFFESVVMHIEQHEAGEFFRVGDQKPFDPHGTA